MYTIDEINTILTDLDACGQCDCRSCSRSGHGHYRHFRSCLALNSDAASAIRWLLSEFHRYGGEQTQLGEEAPSMPDILIRGMGMPKTCFECPFMYSRRFCSANNKIEFSDEKYFELEERHPSCPLHKLSEHGDLIDKKAVMEAIDNIWDGRPLALIGAKVLAMIDSMPVIVPGNKEASDNG